MKERVNVYYVIQRKNNNTGKVKYLSTIVDGHGNCYGLNWEKDPTNPEVDRYSSIESAKRNLLEDYGKHSYKIVKLVETYSYKIKEL